MHGNQFETSKQISFVEKTRRWKKKNKNKKKNTFSQILDKYGNGETGRLLIVFYK